MIKWFSLLIPKITIIVIIIICNLVSGRSQAGHDFMRFLFWKYEDTFTNDSDCIRKQLCHRLKGYYWSCFTFMPNIKIAFYERVKDIIIFPSTKIVKLAFRAPSCYLFRKSLFSRVEQSSNVNMQQVSYQI